MKEISTVHMQDDTFIRTTYMNCPLCGKAHEVEERKRLTTIMIKDEEVTYGERFYFCTNADENENEFETGLMANENLLNARKAYCIKKGLITSESVKYS